MALSDDECIHVKLEKDEKMGIAVQICLLQNKGYAFILTANSNKVDTDN